MGSVLLQQIKFKLHFAEYRYAPGIDNIGVAQGTNYTV